MNKVDEQLMEFARTYQGCSCDECIQQWRTQADGIFENPSNETPSETV